MFLQCIEDVFADNDDSQLFTKDKLYEYTPVNNRFTKIKGFVGFTKDDEKYKRWMSLEFKEKYFIEHYILG